MCGCCVCCCRCLHSLEGFERVLFRILLAARGDACCRRAAKRHSLRSRSCFDAPEGFERVFVKVLFHLLLNAVDSLLCGVRSRRRFDAVESVERIIILYFLVAHALSSGRTTSQHSVHEQQCG